jgi:hypothetical protein
MPISSRKAAVDGAQRGDEHRGVEHHTTPARHIYTDLYIVCKSMSTPGNLRKRTA